jgi:hypothetical protein
MALSRKIMTFAETEAERFGFKISHKQTKDKIIFVLDRSGKQSTYALPANKHKGEHFFIDMIKTSVRRINNELRAA